MVGSMAASSSSRHKLSTSVPPVFLSYMYFFASVGSAYGTPHAVPQLGVMPAWRSDTGFELRGDESVISQIWFRYEDEVVDWRPRRPTADWIDIAALAVPESNVMRDMSPLMVVVDSTITMYGCAGGGGGDGEGTGGGGDGG